MLGRRSAAGLLGGTPCARDSGLRSGERRIPGGRPHPRRVLSRAALSASRGHPPRRACSQRLRARAQAALVAVLRKLIVLADILLRQDRLGSAQAPLPERARGRAQHSGRTLLVGQRPGAPGTYATARFRAGQPTWKLLHCDEGEGHAHRVRGEAIAETLRSRARQVDRVKRRFVEEGLEAALDGR